TAELIVLLDSQCAGADLHRFALNDDVRATGQVQPQVYVEQITVEHAQPVAVASIGRGGQVHQPARLVAGVVEEALPQLMHEHSADRAVLQRVHRPAHRHDDAV